MTRAALPRQVQIVTSAPFNHNKSPIDTMDFLKAMQRRLGPPSRQRIQILSDLHLEVGQQYSSYDFPASAPFLLLAGDIGRLIDYDEYLGFLNIQVSRYKKVFLVLGNHEFYGLDYDAGLQQARRLAAEPSLARGLVLLHRAQWDDPDSDLSIVGCTLWSSIPESIYEIVESKVKDYNNIHEWSPTKHNQIHAEEVAWLRERIAQFIPEGGEHEHRQLLVATHYAPCIDGSSSPEHTANPWTPAFATDVIPQGNWSGKDIKTWSFGHTHYSTEFLLKGIRLIANQRGYVLPGSVRQEEEGKQKKRGKHEFDATRTIAM